MATREERTTAYQEVVEALIDAALIDGYMERVAIAKAIDALGPIISDVDPHVVATAIEFRNGPLLRDHQPVSIYLKQDPKPVKWVFTLAEVLALIRDSMDYSIAHRSIGPTLVRAAHRKISEHTVTALIGFNEDAWCATLDADGSGFTVTLYPDVDHPYLPADALRYMNPDRPEPAIRPGVSPLFPGSTPFPRSQLPTILIDFDELLGTVDVSDTVELTIINCAEYRLLHLKPEQHAKLTPDWWANVEVTDIGYLVTFHYDTEFPI